MGSYSTLYIGQVQVALIKNDVDPTLMTLFRPSDKRVYGLNEESPEYSVYVEDGLHDDEAITLVRYVCSRSVALDRLELQGFTLEIAKHGFQLGMASYMESLSRIRRPTSELQELYEAEARLVTSIRVDDWLATIRRLWQDGLLTSFLQDVPPGISALEAYVLTGGGGHFGFRGNDLRHFLRLILEIAPSTQDLVYDLTDLVLGGWIDTATDLVDVSLQQLEASALLSPRRIVLTEGKTDQWVLEKTLQLLKPHLADCFSFLDFEGARVGGGAGALANIVKSFAGAGISNRVVALFDNDAAGRVALNSLSRISLPKNIVVQRYPDLALARNYPTLGPTGRVSMDVNGLAGSIELYLGRDVLADADGALMPIQWRGYESQLDCYQGELLNKVQVMDRFRSRVATCEKEPSRISDYDWTGIQAVLQSGVRQGMGTAGVS